MSNNIKNGKSVFDNGVKLLIEPLPDIFGHGIAVIFLHSVIADAAKLLVGAFNLRRICSVGNGLYLLAHIGNKVGVFYNNFISRVLAEIGKFIKHILRCSEIKRSLLCGVLKSLTRHQDFTEYLIALVHKVDIACCHNRLAQLIGKMNEPAVKLVKLLLGVNHTLAHHKGVVAVWLNFNIVINLRHFKQRFLCSARKHSLIKLTRFAGTSDNKPLSVSQQLAFGNSRMAVIVFKI